MEGSTSTPVGILPELKGLFPEGVFPTPVRLLEQNGRFLVIHELNAGRVMPEKHERMWKRWASLDGVTVICVWGRPPAQREAIQIFDHRGMMPKKPVTTAEFKQAVHDWWREAAIWAA